MSLLEQQYEDTLRENAKLTAERDALVKALREIQELALYDMERGDENNNTPQIEANVREALRPYEASDART